MTEQQNQQQQRYEDEIDLKELIMALWRGKWLIIAVTFVFAVGSVVYAINQPNIYRSEALLAPVEESSGMNIPGQLGGLAALAGVNIGSGGGDKVQLALEILKSREFLGRFIEKYELKVPVMAAIGWNRSSGELIIDDEIYEQSSGVWLREVGPPRHSEPSVLETYDAFKKLMSASQDQQSGMIKVSIEHYSPNLAAEWVTLLIQEINHEMRGREVKEATDSISFLQNQLRQTQLTDAQSMLYSLIEEQTKTLMLANVRPEYILRTVDPAVIPEIKSGPSRFIICLVGTIFGGMLSVLYTFTLFYWKKREL